MRKYINLIYLVVLFSIALGLCYYTYHAKTATLEVGQIWVEEFGTEDPFKTKCFEYSRVLDIKDGYVLFETDGIKYSGEFIEFNNSYTFSRKVEYFMFESEIYNK